MSSFYPLSQDENFPNEEEKAAITSILIELVKCEIDRCQDLFDYLSQALEINDFYLKQVLWEILSRHEVELSADRTRIIIPTT